MTAPHGKTALARSPETTFASSPIENTRMKARVVGRMGRIAVLRNDDFQTRLPRRPISGSSVDEVLIETVLKRLGASRVQIALAEKQRERRLLVLCCSFMQPPPGLIGTFQTVS
jgi:hypothetical protein